MKRTERVGALIRILTESPNKIYSLQYFCDLFGAAKSSISEDIQSASQAIELTGSGCLETTPGSKGGVRFVPDISPEAVAALQADFAQQLSDPSRLLGGNFLYTSDIFYDSDLVMRTARVFAKKFQDCGADCVATVETKGIPLAFTVAHMLGIPLVVHNTVASPFLTRRRFRRARRSASIISAVPMTACRRCPWPNAPLRRALRS